MGVHTYSSPQLIFEKKQSRDAPALQFDRSGQQESSAENVSSWHSEKLSQSSVTLARQASICRLHFFLTRFLVFFLSFPAFASEGRATAVTRVPRPMLCIDLLRLRRGFAWRADASEISLLTGSTVRGLTCSGEIDADQARYNSGLLAVW
jgi:hypothetical protein